MDAKSSLATSRSEPHAIANSLKLLEAYSSTTCTQHIHPPTAHSATNQAGPCCKEGQTALSGVIKEKLMVEPILP